MELRHIACSCSKKHPHPWLWINTGISPTFCTQIERHNHETVFTIRRYDIYVHLGNVYPDVPQHLPARPRNL